MAKDQSPATVDETEIVPVEAEIVPVEDPDAWWDEEEADEVEGFDLAKDAVLFTLVGVPLRMYRVTFNEGKQQKGIAWVNDFASIELRVAPAKILQAKMAKIMARRSSCDLITDKNDIAEAGERLVRNDGSTGIYRQIVQYLEAKKLITLPDDMPEEGEKGESRYDLPHTMWLTGGEEEAPSFDIRLDCPRGLRYSDYTNEYTGKERALTWYIA